MYKLEGILESIGETRKLNDKFSIREFIVKDITNVYPQEIIFQLTQEKCVLLDNLECGDILDITFNINGKRWESPTGDIKHFNSLVCWRLEKSVKEPIKTTIDVKADVNNAFTEKIDQSVYTLTADDDLPF